MNSKPAQKTYPAEFDLLGPLLAAAGLALLTWMLPAAACWLTDGHLPQAIPSIEGTVKLIGHHAWEDPATAYPAAVRAHLPRGPMFWWPAALGTATLVATGGAAWRAIDTRRARSVLGRRPYDLAGARPRAWARPRDLTDLIVRSTHPDRFALGAIDRRKLASHPEAHVAVVAPTRSGKTTRCVIPWLLEHHGPAIVTSTKTDVLHATRDLRAARGTVTVWDPFGPQTAHWSPLTGCQDWSLALRQAQWLGDAAQDGDSEVATFWRGEAARLLAPLLHAAALGGHPIGHVIAWLDGQDAKEPITTLRQQNAEPALRQLSGVLSLDPRNRGTIYMSAASLLAAYRLPEVLACATTGFTAEHFLNGDVNTLYIVAPARQQRLLAPLIVALLSSILHAAAEHANEHGPLTPTLRALLDEAANIAPLRDLPQHLSQAAGHGIRIATVWQSVAQIEHRYFTAASDILANSTAQLYLGPIADPTTQRHLDQMLGTQPETERHPGQRSKATSAALQQLSANHALLIEGRHPPAIVRLKPWWKSWRKERQLRTRGRHE